MVETFMWIVGGGLLMSAIAMVGSVTLLLKESTLQRILLPLVAFAAGSLLGGAFFHMIPAAVATMPRSLSVYLWVLVGFSLFLALEQFLHWHHCRKADTECRKPVTYLILIGDALHNFLGGLAVGGIFLIDVRLGVLAWIAAAAHEVPQELGDFAVLVHGGWRKGRALLYNVLSGMTFLVGGIVAYIASGWIDTLFLVPFAAGNFIYIGASDLIPEVKHHHDLRANLVHFIAFLVGVLLMLAIRMTGGS